MFVLVMECGSKLKAKHHVNRNYYPFYIFKILDLIIPKTDLEQRKILSFIYLQKADTTNRNIIEWNDIQRQMDMNEE